ncbi:MAG: DedA family protein [Candidatus Pacearchaeota archaeon]|jgi:membrane protein DedA with SNARE-associated domain
MALVEFILSFATSIISSLGYFGVVILMALESMVFPMPSEAVMPFAGFLIHEGKFTILNVIIFSTIGTIIGSLISYYIGFWLGKPFFEKYGKYFFLNKHHLHQTENFFKKYGDKTIFISRFIPVVRHLISIPAGVSKMNIWKFLLYTILGGIIWNTFLTYLGIQLGERWELVHEYSKILDYVIVAIIIIAIIWFVIKMIKKRRQHQ